MHTVAIVGVGLIGGSFALALKKAGFNGKILGVSSGKTTREAMSLGVIDEALPLSDAARRADLIYLAQPIGRILDTLRHIDDLAIPGSLITDAGSTKGAIVALAGKTIRRCQFLGGHPMAGKEKRGVGVAEADLFAGRTYVLTPASAAGMETPAVRTFVDWLRRIGAAPVIRGPEEHDRIVSFTSHLPQLASTALAATVAESLRVPADLEISGPGLADSVRLAGSSYEIWRDILATNSEAIDLALTAYITKLEHLRTNLRTRQMQEEFEIGAGLAARLRR